MSYAFHFVSDNNREQTLVYADQLKKLLWVRWGGDTVYHQERAILIWKYSKDGQDQRIKVDTLRAKLGGIVKKIEKIVFIRTGITNDEYLELADIEEACLEY